MLLRIKTLIITLLAQAVFLGGDVLAQDLSGLRIALDPGHGTNSANQGPTGLKEYDVNMKVARFLEQFLLDANAELVILTQVEDQPEPGLSVREDIANSAGVDWFHSIHHNAFNGAARYSVVIYQELIGLNKAKWPEAQSMSALMSPDIYEALRTSEYHVRSDYDIRGFNFGVLNDLLMPGELSEGTFHDNPVEERKLRNDDFLRLEAAAIYKSLLTYFGPDSLNFAPLSGFITNAEDQEPINEALVLIQPGNLQYLSDTHDNGIYAFPDLPSGTYVLQTSAPGYQTRTDTVDTRDNVFNALDIQLISEVLPTVKESSPVSNDSLFSPYDWVEIEFTRQMDRESVEAALTITPEFPYDVRWTSDSRKMRIDPLSVLSFATEYEVSIDSNATDVFGNRLSGIPDSQIAGPYVLRFNTTPIDRSKPQILATEPIDLAVDVPVSEVVRISLNKPLDESRLTRDHIVFLSNQQRIEASFFQTITDSGFAVLSLIPAEQLGSEQRYTITLLKTLADSNAVGLDKSFQFTFDTRRNDLRHQILDNFEGGANNWANPLTSPRSSGLDTDSSALTLAAYPTLRDTSVLQVDFGFNEPGTYDLAYQGPPVDLSLLDISGLYIHGDNSNVLIRLYFSDLADGLEAGPWHRLDWYGWRQISFTSEVDSLFAYDGGNGLIDDTYRLAGVQIQGEVGDRGRIFLDDVFLFTSSTTEVEEEEVHVPDEILVIQGYPNPFIRSANHESIEITYEIPQHLGEVPVTLSVFNVLGQKIRKLVTQVQSPGQHQVSWNVLDDKGQKLPAGFYFYSLQVGHLHIPHRLLILN